MGENWLEVKVMYCKDLKLFNFFQKLSVYALVSLLTDDDDIDKGGGGGGSDKEGDKINQNNNNNNNEKSKVKLKLKLKKQQQRTPTDTEGDANPEWNHEIRFDLGSSFNSLDDFNDDRLFLHFDLRSEATGLLAIGGDRSIGEVWVPLKDLIQPHNLNGIARFVNYEVRTLDGKSNGVINFSFKLNFKQNSLPNTNLPPINIHGYPIHHHHHHANIDQNPPSSPVNLYPPSPSLYSPSSELYYDAVTSPMTPYSPQQPFHQYQYPYPHPFSPLRPPQPVPYPHEFSQPPPPPQPLPYAYPPPPREYQAPSPNWAQYPQPPDPLYGAPSSGGYDYGLVPGSPATPICSQTTWPNHHFHPPGDDHFPPSWNSR